ncbi:hypothetical protein K1719_028807 [Acacia pycnantha]|nr:hypothetical protein K1719_028807 [Acacia pycnantha]
MRRWLGLELPSSVTVHASLVRRLFIPFSSSLIVPLLIKSSSKKTWKETRCREESLFFDSEKTVDQAKVGMVFKDLLEK